MAELLRDGLQVVGEEDGCGIEEEVVPFAAKSSTVELHALSVLSGEERRVDVAAPTGSSLGREIREDPAHNAFLDRYGDLDERGSLRIGLVLLLESSRTLRLAFEEQPTRRNRR